MNLGAVTTLVFDLDGVVWRGDSPIESAITAINALRDAGKRCLFCTNNSSQTQAAFVAKLAGMGVTGVAEEEVITSSSATALYLSAQYTGPFLAYVIGGEGLRFSLQRIGARIVPDMDITEDTNVDCVIAGIDREFSYAKLDHAQRLIRRGALFVATNRDSTYPVEDGVIPGAGAIVSAIETASGVTPVTVGKPRPVMLQLVMQTYKLKPEEIAFIGDRLDTDIVCARRAGVAALLVTTGVTTLQQAQRAKGELRPDAVFPELNTFADVVLNNSPSAELSTDDLPSWDRAPDAPAATDRGGEETPIPESEPLVEEAAAEVPSNATAGTQDSEWPGFTMDTAMAKESLLLEPEPPTSEGAPTEEAATEAAVVEPAAEEAAAAEPVADEVVALQSPAEESPAADSDAATIVDAVWDDSWFSEDEQFEGDKDRNAEVAAAESQPAPAEDAPADQKSKEGSTATGSDGFDWKLD